MHKTLRRLLRTTPTLLIIATVISVAIMATSCEHKPMCEHHPHTGLLQVVFDWRYAPEAKGRVKGMSLYIYPKNDTIPISRIDFQGDQGGIIELLEGEYDFLCMNTHSGQLAYYDRDKIGSFRIGTAGSHELAGMPNMETMQDVPRAEGTEDERVSTSAEPVWSHGLEEYHIYDLEDHFQTVTLYPRGITCNYTVIVEDVLCMDEIALVSGTLSGLAGEVKAHGGDLVGQHNIIPFEFTAEDPTTLVGHFVTFGHCPDDIEKLHQLTIYVVTKDGALYYFTFDVSIQVIEAPDYRNVVIIIRGLSIGPQDDLGLHVNRWKDVEIILPME